jgi:hypothetical protein
MSYAASIAEKTGWPLDFILWRLPLSAGRQLLDIYAARSGCSVRWAD